MTNSEIAHRLVEYCRMGKNLHAYGELFSSDAVAIEPEGTPEPLTEGLDKIQKKAAGFFAMVETLHSMEVSDPLIADDFFSCKMEMDITFKEFGRSQSSEICVYQIKAGKIVKEQFFYVPQVPG